MLSYFPTLLVCILVSLIALAVGMLAPESPKWLWIPGAVLPLLYYHIGFLARRIRSSVDSAAIDSVYYFGFLITVAALAFSAVSIAMRPDDLQLVLLKFGIGLVATGYAVIARMHLLSRVVELGSATTEDAMDAYVRRSQVLVDNVETAIVRINAFSETVLNETRQVHAKAQAQASESFLASARAFEKEMSATCSSAREGIVAIRNLVNDVSFVSERKELNELVSETVSTARDLTDTMKEFGTTFKSGAEAARQASTAMETLERSIQSLNAQISEMTLPGGHVAVAAKNLLLLIDTSNQATQAARDALVATGDLTKQFTANDEMFTAMTGFAQTASEQFQNLTTTAGKLDLALGRFSEATESAESLARDIDSVRAAFPKLADELHALGHSLDQLKTSISESAVALEADVERSGQAVTLLTSNFTEVAAHIINQTRIHQGLPS